MTTVPVIAIDGPSGSGKGTIARRVAEALGYHLLDSGALYRLVALAADEAGLAGHALSSWAVRRREGCSGRAWPERTTCPRS